MNYSNNYVSLPPTPDFSLGKNIQSVYPLLDLVFAYLSHRDLLSVQLVCKSWRETALEHIRARQEVAWFHSISENGPYEIKRSSKLVLNNPHFCIVLMRLRGCTLKTRVCLRDINNFCQVSLVSDCLREHILGYPFPNALILRSNDITSHLDVTHDARGCEITFMAGLTLPEIPDTRIVLIRPQNNDIMDQYVKESETINSLLIFCGIKEKIAVHDFVEELLHEQDPKTVAVAGGVVTGTGNKQYFNGYKFHKISKSTNRDIYCLAFLSLKTEKPKLLSYSLVISNEISAEEFKEELIKFKEEVVMCNQSAAFRFSCSCKHTSRLDEVIAFNALFPNTPLLGMDVFGEIGWDNVLIRNKPVDNSKRRKISLPTLFHEWSTTFLLLTWNK